MRVQSKRLWGAQETGFYGSTKCAAGQLNQWKRNPWVTGNSASDAHGDVEPAGYTSLVRERERQTDRYRETERQRDRDRNRDRDRERQRETERERERDRERQRETETETETSNC